MTKIPNSKLCPVCRAWFYPKPGTRQIFCSKEHAAIGQSIKAARRRQSAKRNVNS